MLEADLSTGQLPANLRKGVVRVELKNSKITAATIYDQKGHVLYQGNEAIQKIHKVVLSWQLTEHLASSTQAADEVSPINTDALPRATNTDPFLFRAPDTGSNWESYPPPKAATTQPLGTPSQTFNADIGACVPRRYRNLSPEYLRNMPRSTRSIYALINGVNSVERIASLLSLPVSSVYGELMHLQRVSAIQLV